MIRLTIRQLEYFQAVVETGSATAAARECNISQAGLSAGIAQLESVLGTQLFVRQKARNLTLTPAGRALRQSVHSVLEQLQELEVGASTFGRTVSGTLRLGCFDTLSPMLVPPLAQYLTQKHPQVTMRFSEGAPAVIEADLRAGKVEGIVSYKEHVSQNLQHYSLGSHPLYVALPPDHDLVTADEIQVQDLAPYPFVLLDQEPIATLITNMLRRAGATTEPLLRSRHIDTIRSFVARGLGFAVTGVRPPHDISFEGLPIVFRPLRQGAERREIVLCTAPKQHLSRRLQISIDFLRTIIREIAL